jgi:hypothetical protein
MQTLVFPRVPSDVMWSNRHPIELCYRHEVFRIAFLICRRNRFKDLARRVTEFLKVDENSALRTEYDPRNIPKLVATNREETWLRLREETRETLGFALGHVVLRGPAGDLFPRCTELRLTFMQRIQHFPKKRYLAIDRGDETSLIESDDEPGSGAKFYVDRQKYLRFHMWAFDRPSPTMEIKYEGSVKVNFLVAKDDLV